MGQVDLISRLVGGSSAGSFDYRCVGVVVAEDFAEGCATLGHGLRSGLAKSDAVALADSLEDEFVFFSIASVSVFFPDSEVVARDRTPAEAAIYD